MQLSITNTKRNIQFMHQQYQRDGEMLDQLASCKLQGKDRNRFAAGIYEFGKFSPPPMVMGTINELQSTGRLGLLRDLGLRGELAKVLQFSQGNFNVLMRMILPRATPEIEYVTDQALVREPRDGESRDGYDFNTVMREGIPTGMFSFDFPSLCKDARLASSIANVQQLLGTDIWENEKQQKYFQALVEIIDHDLKHMQ